MVVYSFGPQLLRASPTYARLATQFLSGISYFSLKPACKLSASRTFGSETIRLQALSGVTGTASELLRKSCHKDNVTFRFPSFLLFICTK